MSTVCKYYLKGKCMYGNRCHYLHENNGGYNSYNRYDRNYSAGYYDRQSYKENYAQNPSYQNYNYQKQNSKFARGYDQYHVDRRQNRKPERDSADITSDFLLKVIREELHSFTYGKVWPFTVISIGAGYGNLPGYKDISPDEIHYQYCEFKNNNCVHEFEQNLQLLYDNIKRTNELFESNSEEALKVAEYLLLKHESEKDSSVFGEQHLDSKNSAASSFTFDIKKLKENKLTECMNTDIPAISGVSYVPLASADSNFSFSSVNKETQAFRPTPSDNGEIFSSNSHMNQAVEHSQTNTSIFDSNANINQNISISIHPLVQNLECSSLYSNVENLSNNDIQSFQAKAFTLGNVPLVPPPKNYCQN